MRKKHRICAMAGVMAMLLFSEVNANTLDSNLYRVISGIENDKDYYHDDNKVPDYNDIKDLNLSDIVYLEDEGEVTLGFDTYFYLPEGFNPYEGMKIDLNDIHYLECEEEIHLNFNVNDFLPKEFDPFILP